MATRFKLTDSTTDPAVLPATQSYTHKPGTAREIRQLLTADNSTLTGTGYNPDAADDLNPGDALHGQFVSDPMEAGIVFTNAETIKMAAQLFEGNGSNNLFLQLFVSIVDEAGTTVQRILRSKVNDGTELAVTTLTNRFHSTTQDGATYTTAAGDRLVVEISVQGDAVAAGGVQGHNAQLKCGGSGAGGDLPENDTETGTTFNPWIEFVPNITFEAAAGTKIILIGPVGLG